MNIEEAVHAHAEWKMKFRGAIAKKAQMDAASIGRDNCCTIGQWLHGEGKARLGAKPEYLRALNTHKAFHQQAGRVATMINAGDYAQAEASMNAGTPYANASNEVAVALIALKKAANL